MTESPAQTGSTAGGAPSSGRPPAPKTVGEMLAMARTFLERKQLDEARLEAEWLVAHALETDRLQLFLRLETPVTGAEVDRARDLLVRRGRAEPVAYLTGEREFYGRPFAVGSGVLIPRPETELIVDRARELFAIVPRVPRSAAAAAAAESPSPEARDRVAEAGAPVDSRTESSDSLDPGSAPRPLAHRVLDVGTGSGCLAVTLALELASSQVVGVDLSAEALAFARRNAQQLGATVQFLEGDGPEAAKSAGPFDLLVSNPPYVEPNERGDLAPDVREHEPAVALFAPEGDPDHWVRRLLSAARELLAPGGVVLIELGHRQGPRMEPLAAELGFVAEVRPDYSGIPRVLEARRAP